MKGVVWVIVAGMALGASALDLAVRGRAPEYAIVHAADASSSVVYAAEELRDFTEKMTGVRLPIVTVADAARASLPPKAVFLNMSRLSSQVSCPLNLGNDGFSLKVAEGDLLVTGGKRGVLYGVYELLERYGGCRWYASWHTVVPARDAFSVPDGLDDAQTPAFPHREPFWWDMFNGDFAARNRANGPAMRVGAKHGGPAGRFGGGLGNCHTFNRLLPPEKYFDEHPEYFSMVKGTRLKERTQLCLTNPDVLRIVTSNVLACIRKDPTADYYGVSQNDWYNYCECPACAAVDAEEESHAGTMVRFVNAIAEAVEREFPDKIIETLAYQYTRKPPKKTKLRHNVMPCLCTIECDFSRPLPASGYHQNVKFVDEIKAWHAQATRLYVWDYVTDFHCYPYPFPDAYALQGNVQFFRDNGVYALFEQGDRQGCNAGFAELKAWLLAKWMWNPDRPMKPLLDDFFAGFYGAGAPFVREYFEELHRLQIAYTSADTNRWLNCHQNIPSPDIPAEFWDRADALLEKAAAAVKGEKTLEFNVRTARFGVDYVRLEHFRKKRGAVVDLTGGTRSCASANTGGAQLAATALARRALAFVDEVKHMRLCSSLPRHTAILDAWRRLADGTNVARTDGVVEDAFLHLLRLGDGNERVDDPLAEDGHAAKIANPQPRWSVNFPMSDAAFASGTRYSVQMRLRADLVPGRKGPAVTAGIYDPKTKKHVCSCSYPAEKLSGEYAWYTIGTFDPATLSDQAYLFVGDGYLDKSGKRFVPALYLDKLRFAPVARQAAVEPWFGAPIPASGEDGREDCGMTAARVFDAPIAGLARIGTLAVPQSADLPEASNASIGFECLDRGLFDPDRCYDTLAAAGVKWARCQTMWSRCEKQKGVYDFSVLDGVVDNLTKRGIRPWFSVTFGNTLYMTNCFTGAAVGCVPTLYGEECRAAWCAYVRALAKRYKGKVTHWEIWNEPNIKHFWQPSTPNADDYLELVKLTGGVIREEIPDAKIGGTTSSAALNAWEKRFFEAGGATVIDFWCGHAYTRVPERLRREQRIASGSSFDYVAVLKDVRAFIDAHGGKHIEIWQGESGFPSWFPAGHWLWWPRSVCQEGWQSQANQAKWLLRRFVTDRRAGIARSSFFQMADISRHYSMALTTQKHPAEHGIVNGWTYKPKMSCHAFAHYNALLATAKHDESIKVSLTPASDAGTPTVATAFRAADGKPLFLYYAAFDFSGSYTGTCYTARCDAKLSVPAAFAPKDPVLVDMLRGGVYSVSSFAKLPLVDYPLILADRSQVPLTDCAVK